jgi:hypothetical protein
VVAVVYKTVPKNFCGLKFSMVMSGEQQSITDVALYKANKEIDDHC